MYKLNIKSLWYERRDSNSHGLPHWNLNPARLPIPPLSQTDGIIKQYALLVKRYFLILFDYVQLAALFQLN